jgi:cytochrome bd-type quinol oxidase subunit 2
MIEVLYSFRAILYIILAFIFLLLALFYYHANNLRREKSEMINKMVYFYISLFALFIYISITPIIKLFSIDMYLKLTNFIIFALIPPVITGYRYWKSVFEDYDEHPFVKKEKKRKV